MNILLINWQDRENPQAGGAEVHLHEIFGRLVRRGHRVTLLASGWPGAPRRAILDGIEILRVGGRYSFAAVAPRAGRALLRAEHYDLVLEALNKVPTFAPAWARRPCVLLVHHLFGAAAFQEAVLPLAAATWLLERPLPRVYRGVPVQAISHSTADDLVARGLRRRDIQVIHPGVDLDFFHPSSGSLRSEVPTFLYVGRLKRYKRVDLILHAIAELQQRGAHARLVVAGRGAEEPHLRLLVERLGIRERVEFAGFVSEDEKRDLLRRSWANVYTSPKEGWGITNLEAAACGTPCVASDSPGLRETVVPGETGLLVPHGDPATLAAALAALAADRAQVEALGRAAHRFAQRFTWDATAEQTEDHLLRAAAGVAAGGEAVAAALPGRA